MSQPSCSEKGCIALANASGKCTAHAAGYYQHHSAHELRCWHCRRRIERGDWYRRDPQAADQPRHVRRCKASKLFAGVPRVQ